MKKKCPLLMSACVSTGFRTLDSTIPINVQIYQRRQWPLQMTQSHDHAHVFMPSTTFDQSRTYKYYLVTMFKVIIKKIVVIIMGY